MAEELDSIAARLAILREKVAHVQGYPGYTPSPTALAARMLEIVELMQEITNRIPRYSDAYLNLAARQYDEQRSAEHHEIRDLSSFVAERNAGKE